MDTTRPLDHERAPATKARLVGRYVLLRKIGEGGHGEVFRAYDPALDRLTAIKLLHGSGRDGALLREARILARLSHPSIVAAYDVGVHEGRAYLTLELIEGSHLGSALERPLRGRALLRALVEAGQGVVEAHRRKVVHGDIKPSNLLVGADGRIRITDFGVARLLDEPEHIGGGTAAYLAPEQHEGAPASFASDQYSFALTMWEALAGRYPWPWPTTEESSRTHARIQARLLGLKRTPAPTDPTGNIPRGIARALRRALEPDPSARWPSMSAFVDALDRARVPHRRRITAAVLGLVTVVSLIGGWQAWERARRQCAGAAQQMIGVWDDQHRDEIERVFSTGAPYAREVWTPIAAELDRYALRWRQAYTEACEATRRGEQSSEMLTLRMACLHRAKLELAARVEVLSSADATAIAHAHELPESLPPLSGCADLEALRTGVAPPSPRDAPMVEKARPYLAEGRARLLAGDYLGAEQALERARATTRSTAYRPIQVELGLLEGAVLEKLSKYPEAETAYRGILASAAELGAHRALARAAAALIDIVGERPTRIDEALANRDWALALAKGDPALEAAVSRAVAKLLMESGEYAEAEAECRRPAARLERALGKGHPKTIAQRSCIGNALHLQAKENEAQAEFRIAIEQLGRQLGPEHPELVHLHTTLGNILESRGRYEEAEAQHQRGIEIARDAFGPKSAPVARLTANLGNVYARIGRYEDAVTELRRSIELLEAALWPEHPDLAAMRNNLGSALQYQGKYAEAEVEHRRALDVQVRVLGVEHPDVATTRNNIGAALLRRGNLDEAQIEFEQGLAILEATVGADHPATFDLRQNLGAVLFAQERYAEAEAVRRRAIAALKAARGPEHPEVAPAYNNLGNALFALGRYREAEVAHRRALSIWEGALGRDHPFNTYALTGLGGDLLGTGHPREARVVFERALELHEAHGNPAELRAETRFGLAKAML